MLMKRYTEFILRKPLTVLVLMLVITIVLGSGIWKIKFDNSYDVMMPQKDALYLFDEETKKVYGNLDNFVIMAVSAPRSSWSAEFFSEFNNLISDIEEYKDFDQELEENRIKRLREYAGLPGPPTVKSLIEYFNDDPAWQRALKREFDDNAAGGSIDMSRINDQKNIFTKKIKGDRGILSQKINGSRLQTLIERMVYLKQLKEKRLVDEVICPITAKDMSGENDTLASVDLISEDEEGQRILPSDQKGFNELEGKLRKNRAFKKALYSVNESDEITDMGLVVKYVNVRKHDDITKEIWNITCSYRNLKTVIQGVPIVNKYLNDYMHNDLINFLPPVFIVITIVFFLNFMSVRGVLLPLATLILGDIWLLGLMGHLGFYLTMLGVSIPTLMVAVGSSYSIHIINQYYLDIDEIGAKGKFRGLSLSMTHISTTVLLAGLTTFLGFLSLISNQVSAIREWGLFSAIGVIFAVIISTTLIPACMVLLPEQRKGKGFLAVKSMKKGPVDSVIELFVRISTVHYRKVIAVTSVIIVLSLIGAMNMKVETTVLSYFKDNDEVRKSHHVIGRKLGGSFGTKILIDSGRPDGIKEPEFLKKIEEIRAWLESPENRVRLHVGRTDAFDDVIKTMHMAMNNDSPEYYRIPSARQDIWDYLEIYSGDDDDFDGRFDDFESYLDSGYRTAMIFVKHNENGGVLGTEDFGYIQDEIRKYLDSSLGKGYEYKISGLPAIIVRLSEYVVSGQLMSLMFSLITVILIVIFLFRNWRAGFLSLIPMGTAIIMNFGIMGWFGIALDYATSIIACIVIGIGVDDTIHFLNSYRSYMNEGNSVDDTLRKTLSVSGKAIVYTSIALIFGFSVLTISNFKPIIFFGILSANTMVSTTLGALIVLPSVIKATGADLSKNESNSFLWRFFDIGRLLDSEGPGEDVVYNEKN